MTANYISARIQTLFVEIRKVTSPFVFSKWTLLSYKIIPLIALRPSELTATQLPTIPPCVKSRLWPASAFCNAEKSFPFINLTTNTAHSVTPLSFMHIIKHAVIICIGSLLVDSQYSLNGHVLFIHSSVCMWTASTSAAAEIIHLKISYNGFNSLLRSLTFLCGNLFSLLFSINQRSGRQQ